MEERQAVAGGVAGVGARIIALSAEIAGGWPFTLLRALLAAGPTLAVDSGVRPLTAAGANCATIRRARNCISNSPKPIGCVCRC